MRDGRFIRIRTKEPTVTFPNGFAVKQSTIRSVAFDGLTSCEAEVVGWEPLEINSIPADPRIAELETEVVELKAELEALKQKETK